jgi:hypothetical protein
MHSSDLLTHRAEIRGAKDDAKSKKWEFLVNVCSYETIVGLLKQEVGQVTSL